MERNEVEKILDRLMTPHEVLDPRIFDYKEEMLPEVREALLKLADRRIEKLFAPIKGLEVYDICLTGSSTSYFYHDKSDIDMSIEIHNKNCPFLTKDLKLLGRFLHAISNRFHKSGYIEQYGGRLVDIKTYSRQFDIMGLYSIKKNKWRIYPDHDIYTKISKEEILDLYFERKAQIEADVAHYKQTLDDFALGDKLELYHREEFDKSVNAKTYLLFKLLVKTKILRSLGAESILAYNRGLSLSDNAKQQSEEVFTEEEKLISL